MIAVHYGHIRFLRDHLARNGRLVRTPALVLMPLEYVAVSDSDQGRPVETQRKLKQKTPYEVSRARRRLLLDGPRG